MQKAENVRLNQPAHAGCSDNAPNVSVIIPAYNIAPYIAETLTSVFAQTYRDFEVIIVNDGSKDTAELKTALKPFFDKIIYAEQANAGASQARNSAISLAHGRYLAFLDGDDIWLPHFFAVAGGISRKENLEMVYADAEIFGEELFEGRSFMKRFTVKRRGYDREFDNGRVQRDNFRHGLKKDLLEKFGTFDAKIPRSQDFDLWFRLAKSGAKIGYQRKILLKYRMRPDNLSGSSVKRAERNIIALETIEKKYEFDKTEREVWARQMALCEAELELEKGKFCLANGDFSEAQTHIAAANKFSAARNYRS